MFSSQPLGKDTILALRAIMKFDLFTFSWPGLSQMQI